MPPFVSRKREHSPDPPPTSSKRAKTTAKQEKPTLFEAADTPQKKIRSAAETKKFLDSLDDDDDDDDDDDESLSDVYSDEFEDVAAPPAKKQKVTAAKEESEDGGDDEEMDWEDAIDGDTTAISNASSSKKPDPEIGDIDISLNEDGSYVEEPLVSLATGKKGPSKRERQIRLLTHCLHVQSLMWHNTVRNSWLNDKDVQKTLVDDLPKGVKQEVTRWREAMGSLTKEELQAKKEAAAKAKGKGGRKGKSKQKSRDWSYDAEHAEQGVPNLSQGDPLLRLLKVLTAYWRKRFAVTAPALRKQGYMPLKRLREELKHWDKNRDDAEDHGERIDSLAAFRELAKKCEGSRDVGGQLFAALLRGLGLEARMVANLQPAGIGWSKTEEAHPAKTMKEKAAEKKAVEKEMAEQEVEGTLSSPNNVQQNGTKHRDTTPSAKRGRNGVGPGKLKEEKPTRKSSRGNKSDPINLDDSDSPLSDPPSDEEAHVYDANGDDLSVVDVTPSVPKKRAGKKYDRDLAFPTYWTEVCSPASHKWIPVDPIVLSTIASNEELPQTFEPRGTKADKAKQVICYILGFSADGSAKDVTVRYLKKHQLPGKTKGMRMPVEKVAIYNKRGKVKKYEEFDWFRTVMSGYDRPHAKRTPADDLEEQTDLKPFKPAKEEKEVEKESLQWYKQSAEFVLEQHLRREEAILPGAKPVKTFTAGKGEKSKAHPVYRRDDVVACKTVESWHKEGRAVNFGEQPMKHVPVRAVTLARKREMEETLRETGEKMQQGLYSWDQTDWIIPPPIENGVIPKNAFGNMDVYVETMVPKGAVHLPLKGSAKLCRKLEIDYAEACTGFEFGKQRAVPILTGVVVAQENAQMVRDAWRAEQKEIKRKEDTKRTAAALHWWRKMVMGMRIVERMRTEYEHADAEDEINPFVRRAKREGRNVDAMQADEGDDAGAGGFFRPGHEEEEVPRTRAKPPEDFAGGFLADSEDEVEAPEPEDGGFLVEDKMDEPSNESSHAPVTSVSLPVERRNEEQDESLKPSQKTSKRASTQRTAAKKPAKPTARRSSKRVVNPEPTSDEESPLSDLEGDEEQGGAEDAEDEKSPLKRQHSSPQVVISPLAKTSTSKPAKRSTRGRAAKSTPTRSQYFSAANDDHDDEEEDEDSSEQEVVKPTRTTARTRSKK